MDENNYKQIYINLFKVILFDLDGTLIDSMRYHYISWKTVLKKFNIQLIESDYYPLEGMSLIKIAEKLTKNLSLNKSQLEKIVEEKKSFFNLMSSNKKINFYSNVIPFINLLSKNKIPIGLVTASHLSQIKATLDNSFLKKFGIFWEIFLSSCFMYNV